MPKRAKTFCCRCGKIIDSGKYCDEHKPDRVRLHRNSAAVRGYDRNWQKIRKEVLRKYGIPEHLWPLYDVDHNPAYDPEVERDHRKYELIPRLHSDHSSKTAKHDGGFGNAKAR